jgi:hypothetical protein
VKEPLFGATGKFPEGKLSEHDEGALRFGVAVYKGTVVLDFGTPVASLGLSPVLARELARSLMEHADRAVREHEPEDKR